MKGMRCVGVGVIVSGVYEGVDKHGRPFINFLVRLDGHFLVRINLWGISESRFREVIGCKPGKGVRVEFSGEYSGTYQEKPSVNVTLSGIRVTQE